jgi:cation diffusion facilitator family transporter
VGRVPIKYIANRDKQVQKLILLEGSANLVVLLAKTVVGLSTGSLAILGDAVHSLTDVANNVIAWCVIRFSSQPADREHPYGHRKFETLAVFGLATLLAVFAIELALHAVRRENAAIISDPLWIGLMLGVLGVNIVIASWQRYWAQRLGSELLLADANHTFADVLTTIVVIGGWQLSAMGYPWLDTLCAFGVAALILYLAYGLFRRTFPVLVDEISIDPDLVIAMVRNEPDVRNVLRVRSRWIGSNRAVDMVITVDADLSTSESHAVADTVEKLLQEKLDVEDISIHIEPDTEKI